MNKRAQAFLNILLSSLLSLFVIFAVDIICILAKQRFNLFVAIGIFFVLNFVWLLIKPFDVKQKAKTLGIIVAVLFAVTAAFCVCETVYIRTGQYRAADNSYDMYKNRRVMVIATHEDDDYNIAGGAIEQYVNGGSEVYVVFATNGDKCIPAEKRFNEAITALSKAGVKEENIIFLGYADNLVNDNIHFYNSDDSDRVFKSEAGKTATYGTASKPAYNDGNPYTADNIKNDMYSVICEYKPDVIICNDYDHHYDHKAVSLIFESAMGSVLKDNADYRPTVYKAYAYSTAWRTVDDYFSYINIASTKNCFKLKEQPQFPANYRWSERMRFPLAGDYFNRSLFGSAGYRQLQCYDTQNAVLASSKNINGDKVAWLRRTDSLLYNAKIKVSSGNDSERLNNFMLLDSAELTNGFHYPYDSVFSFDKDDDRREIEVTLSEKSYVSELVLYDNPSPKKNIISAEIICDDGDVIEIPPLYRQGAATRVSVNKELKSFKIKVLKSKGRAGLAELEAFTTKTESPDNYIKLVNRHDDFVYDYIINSSGSEELSLYSPDGITADTCTVTLSNEKCSAEISNGKIAVSCPKGEETLITVQDEKTGLKDSAYISNPSKMKRLFFKVMRKAEKTLLRLNPRARQYLFHKLYYFIKACME